jgi:hypothetical protein
MRGEEVAAEFKKYLEANQDLAIEGKTPGN